LDLSSAILTRLFALTGTAAPAGTPLARLVARCPRERLVRVVAWHAWERLRGLPDAIQLTGVRLLVRGWDDFYMTTALPSGAERVDIEALGDGRALVTRHGREGRGWRKERISTVGEVRPEIELATRWLGSVAGCIVHDDCAANPELGAACALAHGVP
jgi:hypothetical protein